jgi:ubiquinone/menaquinone biosynthesis C-methylase UbiE
MNLSLSRNAPRIDHRANKVRQQSDWASGDYAVAGSALQIAGEELCESMNLYQDSRVLDVALGNGHAALAAARRWCDVTSTTFASDVARRGGRRTEAENLGVRFVEGDAEDLPFADQAFDAVVSTFGAMFAADQERAAAEMIRVCRRGGAVGLTSWTPDGFIGQLFRRFDRHAATAVGVAPFQWGTEERLAQLFGAYGDIEVVRKHVVFRCLSPADWLQRFRASHRPADQTFARLDAQRQRELSAELLDVVARCNHAGDRTMSVDAEYLEVVITRR